MDQEGIVVKIESGKYVQLKLYGLFACIHLYLYLYPTVTMEEY